MFFHKISFWGTAETGGEYYGGSVYMSINEKKEKILK
jgi:hypothetical protein